MTVLTWLSYAFAAVMLTVAAYCAVRPLAARRMGKATELDTDAIHVVMGVAMAGMLAARMRTFPPMAWMSVFAAAAAWFGWHLLLSRSGAGSPWHCPHPLPHLVECAAMLYMFLALPAVVGRPGASGMPAMTATQTRFSLLALAMTAYLVGYAVRQTDRFPAPSHAATGGTQTSAPPPASGTAILAPRCAALCKIAMAVTMSYTLIGMLRARV